MRQQYTKQKQQNKRRSVSRVRSDESRGRGGSTTPTNELAATPRRGKGRQPSRLPKSEETEGTASPPDARTAALTARATATPSRREPERPRTTMASDVRPPAPNARGPVNPSTSDECFRPPPVYPPLRPRRGRPHPLVVEVQSVWQRRPYAPGALPERRPVGRLPDLASV